MYILMVVLIINGQFNSFTDIKFQEFSTQTDCVQAKMDLLALSTEAVGELKLKCVKK